METIALSCPGAGFFESPEAGTVLEKELLSRYLPACRWFGGKARGPQTFRVIEMVSLTGGALVLVEVTYSRGAPETYALALRVSTGGEAIATFSDGATLSEALGEADFRRALLQLIGTAGMHGPLRGERGHALPAEAHKLPSRLLKVEQSNSSLLYGDRIFVKVFRKLEEGLNPDVEITRFLNERLGFPHVPPFAGTLQLTRTGREPQVLALALGLIANEGDAWTQALGEVRAFYERVLAEEASPVAGPALFGTDAPAETLVSIAGPFPARVRQLGQRTGETHLALASRPEDPVFRPEPFSSADQNALSASVREAAEHLFALLGDAAAGSPGAELLARREEVLGLAGEIARHEVQTAKIRTHGDYHLGQVLNTGTDYVLLDFEGEPQRTLAERQQKRSPLRDVAGMLRSFHYAAHSGLGEFASERERLAPWAEAWSALMSRTFLEAWRETCQGAVFLPEESAGVERLLRSFLLEKAVYEVGYELNNRPAWVEIPLCGILQLLHA